MFSNMMVDDSYVSGETSGDLLLSGIDGTWWEEAHFRL